MFECIGGIVLEKTLPSACVTQVINEQGIPKMPQGVKAAFGSHADFNICGGTYSVHCPWWGQKLNGVT